MKQEKDMRVSDIHADPVSPIGANEVPSWNPQGPTDHTCPMPPTPSSDALPGFTPQYTHQFRFWCQHILPLVYEQSLSYYEVLCKIASKLNEVIQSENALNENMVAAVNKINELIEKFNTFITEVKAFLDCFEARMDAVEQRMDAVETELQAFETRINAEMQSFEARIQAIVDQYTALVQQLQTQVQNLTTLVNELLPRVTTNEANIATNTANIATNTANIASLRSDLTALTARVQANETWIRNFKHEKYGYYDVTQGDDPFVGDGTAADTAKLSAILNQHHSVYFPKKTGAYKLGAALTMSGKEILLEGNIEGTGNSGISGSTIISTNYEIKNFGVSNCNVYSVTLKNCGITNSTAIKCFFYGGTLEADSFPMNYLIVPRLYGAIEISGNCIVDGFHFGDNTAAIRITNGKEIELISGDCLYGVASPTARISADGAASVTFKNCKLAGKIVLNNIGKQAVLENCNANGMELDSSMSRITVENCLFENSKTDFESCRVAVVRSSLSASSGNTNLWNDCGETKISGSTVSGMQIRGQQGNTDRFVIVDSVVKKADFGWHVEAEGSQIEIVSGTAIAGKYKNCLLKGDPSNFSGGSYHDCGFVFQTIPVTAQADRTSVFEHCVDKSVRTPALYDNRIPNLNGLTGNAKIEKETVQAGDRVGWKSTSTTGTHEVIRNFNDRYTGVSLRKIYPSDEESDARLIPLNSMFSVITQNLVDHGAYTRLLFSSDPNSQSKYVIADFSPKLHITLETPSLTMDDHIHDVGIVGYSFHMFLVFNSTALIPATTKLFTISNLPEGSPYFSYQIRVQGLFQLNSSITLTQFWKQPNSNYVVCANAIPENAKVYVMGSNSIDLQQYPVPETTSFML